MLTLLHLQTLSHPFLILFITLFLILHIILKKCSYKHHQTKNLPPSPRKLPILGNLHQCSALAHRSLRSLGTKHGPVMLLHFAKRPVLVLQSANAARDVIKNRDLTFADKPLTTAVRRLLYDGKDLIMAPYGDYWRNLRSICVLQLLSSKKVESFNFIRVEETELLMREIDSYCASRSPANLSELFEKLANNVTCRAAFGRKYCEGEAGKKLLLMLRELEEVMGMVSVGELIPWLAWIDWLNGFDHKVERVAKELDDFLEQVIEDHINGGCLGLEREDGDESRENFVEILLKLYKENSIDRVSVKAVILDMLGAGTDTTSAMLEWAMTELLRHPTVLKKLRTEVRAILKQKQSITENELAKMQYLRAVVKETLRFHSPVPLLAREAREDARVLGYDVPKRTMVIINAWAIGRDSASWDEPERFHPERFLNSSIDFKGLDFELIPFGAGRRGCPGTAFALSSVENVLANLVHKFEWELPQGTKFEDLDITEQLGASIRRKHALLAVPTHSYSYS